MKFSQIIDNSFIGKFVDRKTRIWEELNPEKIYVENIRQFFNLSTRIAKFFCEVAVRQGSFIKKLEVQCPNEGRSLGEYNSINEVPEIIECKNCQLLDKDYLFNKSECTIVDFYKLSK